MKQPNQPIPRLGYGLVPIIMRSNTDMLQSARKVLLSYSILSPMLGDPSTKYTLKPILTRSREAWIPAAPPPVTCNDPLLAFMTFQTRNPFPPGVA